MKNGGARPGAGRPKGKKSPATIDREAALRRFRDRVAKVVDPIFNSQYSLAVGEQYLMKVETIGTGAKARKETTIVEDPQTIIDFLNEELNQIGDDEWYYMTTKPANNMALDSLMNRAFGKPQENKSVDITAENPIIFVNEVPSPQHNSPTGDILPDDQSDPDQTIS